MMFNSTSAQVKDPVRGNHVRYTVKDLGTLGGTFSNAFGINNKGDVVGHATLKGDTALHAFLWRKEVMTDLGTLGGPLSAAVSVNDNGKVVGFSETTTPDPNGEDFCLFGDYLMCLPVIWRDGIISSFPTLGGSNGQAAAINNRGQVAGFAETSEEDPTCPPPQVLVTKPVVWENGQPRELPTAPFLDGGVGGLPNGSGVINEKGQVVGSVITCNFSAARAYLWEKNNVIYMGTFGGLPLAPVAINNKSEATGTFTDLATGLNHAFIWEDGVTSDLGALPGHPQAHGNAINDRGEVVGQVCDFTESSCTSFIWRNGVMTDLNAVVPADSTLFMEDPVGINSVGEIVGFAIEKSTGQGRAFLAMPCDEEHANQESCKDEGAAVAPSETPTPMIVMPENIRKMFEQRPGRRYHIPGPEAPRDSS
jgi:probable HAF family extracellular repeat protein